MHRGIVYGAILEGQQSSVYSRSFCGPRVTSVKPSSDVVEVAAHRGLGTASCGPDTLNTYKITPGTHRYAYQLIVL